MQKPRIVKDYDKLAPEVEEQLKLVYPRGFAQHLVAFRNKEGELKKGLPFETEDYYYLIRMTETRAADIIEEDDDYDDDGILKERIKKDYESKYDDEGFLGEYNSNEDNDLEMEDDY